MCALMSYPSSSAQASLTGSAPGDDGQDATWTALHVTRLLCSGRPHAGQDATWIALPYARPLPLGWPSCPARREWPGRCSGPASSPHGELGYCTSSATPIVVSASSKHPAGTGGRTSGMCYLLASSHRDGDTLDKPLVEPRPRSRATSQRVSRTHIMAPAACIWYGTQRPP
jgi:hypothetical protein